MKYENWRELAAECKKSGMSVNAWSKKKNIPSTTCRQWINRLNKESQLVEANSNQDSDLPVWGKIELKRSIQKKPMVSTSDCANNICLKYHDWSIELNSGFSPLLLKQIMKVVESVC